MDLLNAIFSAAMAYTIIVQTTPILLAALGGAFSDKGNILNIALEGMMLVGAFTSIIIGDKTHNVLLAVLSGMAAATVLAVIFAVASLWLKADFIVVGIGVNLLATGMTMFILSRFFGSQGNYAPEPGFPSLPRIQLGPLANIPIIGPAFNNQTIIVYIAFLLVPFSSWLMFRTRYGIHLRSVGTDEPAAIAAGLKVNQIRMGSVLISGLFAGLGGAQLAMASLEQYTQNMTAQRGFIAVAALTFGGAKPVRTMVAALIFGAADAITTPLQQVAGVSSYLSRMLPYVITILALVVAAVRIYRHKKTGRAPTSWWTSIRNAISRKRNPQPDPVTP